MTWPATGDPFRSLGLAPQTELTSDDVRAAWRRTAAATHPDRADGGDPAAFAAAAAAYTVLRTATGRGEALADLRAGPPRRLARRRRWISPRWSAPSRLPQSRGLRWAGAVRLFGARVRRGRPALLAVRVAVTGAVSAVPVLAVGWQPASPAIIVGALTWLLCTGRGDLASAPPP